MMKKEEKMLFLLVVNKNGSGNPPLFTNDEVQFFNQFMKDNINRIKNES